MMRPDFDHLYQIAEDQGGYFTAAQAQEAGISRRMLSHHAKTGRFQRVARGVYRLAHFPASRFEDLFVAWLRAGPKSAISHESALAAYGLSDVLPGEVHVTVPRTASRRRAGMRQHTGALRSSEVTRREGIPLTTVPRTIADLARAGLPEEQILQAIREALERGLTQEADLRPAMGRYGGRAARILEKALSEGRD
ncbi:MAG: type IV toxin-antitoxin system AbiEi family antitoxin domain-containing protein [Deltaproteobacteria bacterium]|nr:type IV toxin-antitoxin system AbiEi family antitoxin domain-containing protein [Deltaproteobacteria bacterium]